MTEHREIERVFREESGRILAALIRVSGSFDRAEDALQDALSSAAATWAGSGPPDNPGAWIMTAARRRLIDTARRERTRRNAEPALAYESAGMTDEALAETGSDTGFYEDDQLRLTFACCHPALNREAQVALTLKTLGGLTTAEIARAFLVPEATLAQRLVRAKQKILEARIPYEVPAREKLPARLESVMAVIYLIFNEGYAATEGDALVRTALADDAIRLGRMAHRLLPDAPEVGALLALMLFHNSRRDARVHPVRGLVPLEEQDRTRWRPDEIAEGIGLLESALGRRRPGAYQLQAAIAAIHSQSPRTEETDWPEIAALYGQLVRLAPTAVIALNHAVAIAMSESLEAGLERIDRLAISGPLTEYRLFHAARADILRRLGRNPEAAAAYSAALERTTNRVEANFLRERLSSIS